MTYDFQQLKKLLINSRIQFLWLWIFNSWRNFCSRLSKCTVESSHPWFFLSSLLDKMLICSFKDQFSRSSCLDWSSLAWSCLNWSSSAWSSCLKRSWLASGCFLGERLSAELMATILDWTKTSLSRMSLLSSLILTPSLGADWISGLAGTSCFCPEGRAPSRFGS